MHYLPCHLYWNDFPTVMNTTSLGNGQWNVIYTGNEKCKCVVWNELLRSSWMAFGSVYCEYFRGSFLGVLCLYVWYSHATSVSNGWVGGSRLCFVLNSVDPITILVFN